VLHSSATQTAKRGSYHVTAASISPLSRALSMSWKGLSLPKIERKKKKKEKKKKRERDKKKRRKNE